MTDTETKARELVRSLLLRIEELKAENAELRGALRPFGISEAVESGMTHLDDDVVLIVVHDGWACLAIDVGDLRRARTLTGGGE